MHSKVSRRICENTPQSAGQVSSAAWNGKRLCVWHIDRFAEGSEARMRGDPQEQLVLMKSRVMERSCFGLQMNRGLSACMDNVSERRFPPFSTPSGLVLRPRSEHFPLL